MSVAATRELEAVSAFASIARTLTESLELPEVLRRIASAVLAMTDSLGVSIIMPRGDLAEFVAHESPPPHSRIPVGYRFRPGTALPELLANRRDPLVILDLHASPMIPDEIKAQIEAQDLIVIPLRVDAELLGALIVAYAELPEHLPVDPAVLRAVGDQAAVAIRNAQLYEAARTSADRLVQAERLSAMGRVVARIAHQLNNPLTTARLIAEGLELEALPESAMEQVRALCREIERAASVVNDVLVFARKGRRQFTPVRVADVVGAAAAASSRRMTAAGVAVDVAVEKDLPLVHGDPRALQQALTNLLHNAQHVLADWPGERRVRIRAAREEGDSGPRVMIDVEDSGPGLAPDLRERVFEPFFTTKPLGEGTGLGLSIAQEIVEVHGGSLEVGDSPLGGALFRIRLPALAGADAGEGAGLETVDSAVMSNPPARAAGERTLRVLVIDDEAPLQQALKRVLEYLGCEVVISLEGEEGYALARAGGFDLILADLGVPGLGGREMFERLRVEAPEQASRVVFMTGDSVSEEVREFLAASGQPVLMKPFGRVQLQALLHEMQGRRD